MNITRRMLLKSSAASAVFPRALHTQSQAKALYSQGSTLYRVYTRAANNQARHCLEMSLDLDPGNPQTLALLAATHRQDAIMAWVPDAQRAEEKALDYATKAVTKAKESLLLRSQLAFALEQLGWVELYSGRLEEALATAQATVLETPESATAYAFWAHTLTFLGETKVAHDKMKVAFKLVAPRIPFLFLYNLGHLYLTEGLILDSKEAYTLAEEKLRAALAQNGEHRPSLVYLVAALFKLGLTKEAHELSLALERMGRPSPLTNRAQFAAYIRRAHPFADVRLSEALERIWYEAASNGEGVA